MMQVVEPLQRREGASTPVLPCRFCGTPLEHTVVDLGMSPLCERYLRADELNRMEPFYPLHVHVCRRCLLVQLQEYVSPAEIFTEYAYFSSYSTTWVEHARRYTELAVSRLGLDAGSLVVELASNDGYLLQHFVTLGIPVLGIEPARNVAATAEARGVVTLTEFFGVELAQRLAGEGKRPDLIVGNNVLAQVPDLNDFVAGTRILLGDRGVATFEFPHLARLFAENQFDTIYHEHFSYFSLLAAKRVFSAHRLTVFDVEELPTHGGSLRLWLRHDADTSKPVAPAVGEVLERERSVGLDRLDAYLSFGPNVEATKRKLLAFLIRAKEDGKRVVGYGAPGKGNTLLNYCGIRTDLLGYTVDRNPYKHGRFLPGTHIPILGPGRIAETRPDYVLILPWNLRDEIMQQLAYVRDWGARFVVPIPEVRVS
jgi:C-methyltransferase C-terminal domain/Putative zinc binding domain/Methyltransferase domain